MSTVRIPKPTIALLALTAACAAPSLHVTDVLSPSPSALTAKIEPATAPDSIDGVAQGLQDRADREARITRAALRSGTPDADAWLEASRALLVSAEVRFQRAVLAASMSGTLERTVQAEENVTGAARTEVLALCEEGRDLAAQALAERPESCEAILLDALHLSLIAWGEGLGRSLLKGRDLMVKNAVVRAAETCPEFDAAGPLRLLGRFRAQSPWPYGDLVEALTSLERASKIAPVPLTLLYLGDARFASKDLAGARGAWRRVADAEPDAATRLCTPLYVELARRRLARLPAL